MANRPAPLFADDRTAATLFCMTPVEFRGLVETGALPGPVQIAGYERWRVSDLEAVATGAAMEEDFET